LTNQNAEKKNIFSNDRTAETKTLERKTMAENCTRSLFRIRVNRCRAKSTMNRPQLNN